MYASRKQFERSSSSPLLRKCARVLDQRATSEQIDPRFRTGAVINGLAALRFVDSRRRHVETHDPRTRFADRRPRVFTARS
jgi:hypothetical protein